MTEKKTLGLISCTKAKQNYPCEASEMYSVSYLFEKAYQYCNKTYDNVGILSAKYGFVLPSDKIAPYDITLNSMSSNQREDWAEKVFEQMQTRLNLSSYKIVFFHAGKNYREYLTEKFNDANIITNTPLQNLTIGKQLQWYNNKLY